MHTSNIMHAMLIFLYVLVIIAFFLVPMIMAGPDTGTGAGTKAGTGSGTKSGTGDGTGDGTGKANGETTQPAAESLLVPAIIVVLVLLFVAIVFLAVRKKGGNGEGGNGEDYATKRNATALITRLDTLLEIAQKKGVVEIGHSGGLDGFKKDVEELQGRLMEATTEGRVMQLRGSVERLAEKLKKVTKKAEGGSFRASGNAGGDDEASGDPNAKSGAVMPV